MLFMSPLRSLLRVALRPTHELRAGLRPPLPAVAAAASSAGSPGGEGSLSSTLDCAFDCVQLLTERYGIDESHGLSHSLNTLGFAQEIYRSELRTAPELRAQKTVIFTAAVLHDLCDKKYVNEQEGVREICRYMRAHSAIDAPSLAAVVRIITSMSYSTVKQRGFPQDLGSANLMAAFHVVREADLLAAYDMDRCVVFGMKVNQMPYSAALREARQLYAARIETYIDDGLFVTAYGRRRAAQLLNQHLLRVGRL